MARFGRIALHGAEVFVEVVDGVCHLLDGAPWLGAKRAGETVPFAEASLLTPTAASKVVCVGQNYRKHAQEMGKPIPKEPLLFLKPASALNPHGAAIVLPPASEEVHHEAELGLVIGQRLSRATKEEALAAIYAVTCVNDVTARDIQRREVQHTRAKSYDTFACVGPVMVTGLDFSDLRIACRVNAEVRQDGRSSDMIFSPFELVAFISQVMTLMPGDVVSTGTPSGVGPIVAGDVVEVDIEGVGQLRNPVVRR